MRVGLDAHMLGSRESGNETYVAGLLQGFEQAAREVCAFVRPMFSPLPVGLSRCVVYSPLAFNSDWARLTFDLNRACVRERVDLLHVTYHAPLFLACPLVTTIHDVSFKFFPHYFSPRDRLLLNTLVPWSASRARAVVTGSLSTQRDLLRFYPFLRGKIYVTPHAVGDDFRPKPGAVREEICRHYHIRPPFVLALGRLDPRKNLGRVIAAWRDLRTQAKCQLVIAGEMGYRAGGLLDSIRGERARGEIVVTGYVPDFDLAALYSASAVFVYPSLYEGFGLPVLEAMACGTPVVTSNLSSLPEVAGDAAIQIDPHETEALVDGMRRVLNDPDLAMDLRAKGQRRAQSFSWRATAEKTWEVYEKVLGI
jgi:glycosyltransferase involved in cell wall biosynthesis